MYSLRIENDQGEIRRIDIDKDSYSIGRLQENDLVLPDINVSRHHVVLETRQDGLVLVDQGSRYGIRMDSVQLPRETALVGGDFFVVGDYTFELILSASEAVPDNSQTVRMASISEEVLADSPKKDEIPAVSVLDGAVGVPYTVAVSEDETLKVLLEMKRRDTASIRAVDAGDLDSFGVELSEEDENRGKMSRTIMLTLMIGAVILLVWFLYSFWMDSELNISFIQGGSDHFRQTLLAAVPAGAFFTRA